MKKERKGRRNELKKESRKTVERKREREEKMKKDEGKKK